MDNENFPRDVKIPVGKPQPPEFTGYPALPRLHTAPSELGYFPSEPDFSADPASPPGYSRMALHEFIITNGVAGSSLKAFASENSMRLFKEYGKLSRKNPDFLRAKQSQNLTVGLPLLVSKRCMGLGLGDTSYLRFFECTPSPEATDRLYDKVDNRPVGEVLRRKFVGYCRYRIQIKGVETVVFAHTRLPVVDLKINHERFRFVKAANPGSHPGHFLYELYLLPAEQHSLVDNMDSSLRVHKDNTILGKSLHNLFAVGWTPADRSKFVSPHKCGTFEYHKSWELFSQTRKRSIFSMHTYGSGSMDANSAVEFRSLILVAVAMVLQSYEDDLHSGRLVIN